MTDLHPGSKQIKHVGNFSWRLLWVSLVFFSRNLVFTSSPHTFLLLNSKVAQLIYLFFSPRELRNGPAVRPLCSLPPTAAQMCFRLFKTSLFNMNWIFGVRTETRIIFRSCMQVSRFPIFCGCCASSRIVLTGWYAELWRRHEDAVTSVRGLQGQPCLSAQMYSM